MAEAASTDNEPTGMALAKEKSNLSLKKILKDFWASLTYDNIKTQTRWFLDSAALEISISFDDLMMAMTLFVLFGGEIRAMAVDKKYDDTFIVLTTICFAFFIVELVLVTWSKTYLESIVPWICDGYFGSFFFILDLFAILSMFPEIPAVAEAFGIDKLLSGNQDGAKLKAARVVRMVRLVRLVKLYKIQSERRRAARLEEELLELVRQGAVSYEDIATQRALYQQRQSKVGGLLSDSITRRVIIIVLMMLLFVPLLQSTVYNGERNFAAESLQYYNINGDTQSRYIALDTFKKHAPNIVQWNLLPASNWDFSDVSIPSLVAIDAQTVYTADWEKADILSSRRKGIELLEVGFSQTVSSVVYSVETTFDLRDEEFYKNLFQILLTIFVSIMLVAGSVVFTNDAQRLVLDPIERMMNMVEAVSKDPLKPLEFQHDGSSGEYETRLLESTIEKITGLLRVGFGEAGAGIIKANLDIADSSSVINPLIPGVRIYAIFGFCDIHHFDDVNQHMGADVLTFVNTIAEIVHSSVHEWGGQSNKNLGNAFLMVWRIGDEKALLKITSGDDGLRLRDMFDPSKAIKAKQKQKQKVVDLRRVPGIDRLSDKALVGYLKIIAELNRNKSILAYRSEPRLTEGGTKPFKVRMGFGLHAGWAIEGAVGSIQKVDATYLSPHVNMAARLETSSKQFGVPLLFSQSLFDLMSVEAQDCCRKLDVVTVKGSENPIGVYTYDARQDQQFRPKPLIVKGKTMTNIKPVTKPSGSGKNDAKVAPLDDPSKSPEKPAAGSHPHQHHDWKHYQKVDEESLSFMSSDNETNEVYENDVDLVYLRRHVSPEFNERFQFAVESYLAGDWPLARDAFQDADAMMAKVPGYDGDGPSRVILGYMENRQWTAPKDWKGYRPLTSK